jgi:serine/threonine-protein kinase HipA
LSLGTAFGLSVLPFSWNWSRPAANGERQLFAFEQDCIDDPQRPTLSLSFKSATWGLVTSARPLSRRVPPLFANLLPEGHLRTYLAKLADVNPEREFFLLAVLGADLPGALFVGPLEGDEQQGKAPGAREEHDDQPPKTALRFSLAGVQLKFSAIREAAGGLSRRPMILWQRWLTFQMASP